MTANLSTEVSLISELVTEFQNMHLGFFVSFSKQKKKHSFSYAYSTIAAVFSYISNQCNTYAYFR